jgi:ATP-dependent exoDNAse (exonuclease V) beta subunit
MIKFIEDSHKYFTENGQELISVSKFYKKFEPFVDWKKIAEKSAKKMSKEGTPMTGEQLQAIWKEKGEWSTHVGKILHSIEEENTINSNDNVSYKTKVCDFRDGIKWSIPINNLENNTVYPELMIYDMDHMICGQSDKVVVKNNKIHIIDYKTDKEIKFKAFSNDWVKPRKLEPPLSHLDECNGNQYAIKMSMYMYMLWKANKGRFMTGDLILEHKSLLRDADDRPVLESGKPVVVSTQKIKLPYLRKEVEAMLKTIK